MHWYIHCFVSPKKMQPDRIPDELTHPSRIYQKGSALYSGKNAGINSQDESRNPLGHGI